MIDRRHLKYLRVVSILAPALILSACEAQSRTWGGEPWPRHTVDDSSSGADGVRLADVNSDGLMDITTGWEEGKLTRVYINPGPAGSKQRWPAVTVGRTPSVEDAVFVDLDSDGAVDVVSSCEGRSRCVFVHWAPKSRADYLKPDAWKMEPVPVTRGKAMWMFALPMQIDGNAGPDVVIAAKGKGASVGWLQVPADPRRLEEWKYHELYKAGWIMSLLPADMDDDGDIDVLVSDRKGGSRGVLWLENPGAAGARSKWKQHRIGAAGREVMFLDIADIDGDGRKDVLAAIKPNEIHVLLRPADPKARWESEVIKISYAGGMGNAKGVRAGDLDGDGRAEIVFSCEGAIPPKRGVLFLKRAPGGGLTEWKAYGISDPEGSKYDRIELLDLDGDKDLDVLICEENAGKGSRGLGVIWYENPWR